MYIHTYIYMCIHIYVCVYVYVYVQFLGILFRNGLTRIAWFVL